MRKKRKLIQENIDHSIVEVCIYQCNPNKLHHHRVKMRSCYFLIDIRRLIEPIISFDTQYCKFTLKFNRQSTLDMHSWKLFLREKIQFLRREYFFILLCFIVIHFYNIIRWNRNIKYKEKLIYYTPNGFNDNHRIRCKITRSKSYKTQDINRFQRRKFSYFLNSQFRF